MSRDSYVYREKKGRGASAPLLFLFHGTGGDEDQLFELCGHLLPGAHLLAPRGDVSEGGALRFFRRSGEGVYDMADLAARTGKMAAFVRAHSAGRPAFGLGYSNGANILANVLISEPALFAGAVLLHPLIPFAPPPSPGLAGKAVLITAGRHDPIAPASQTEPLVTYLQGQGATVETHWHDGGHQLRPEEVEAARAFLSEQVASAI